LAAKTEGIVSATSAEQQTDYAALGQSAYDLAAELFPLCRSITGQGVRDTLTLLERHIPLTRTEVPTGTPALDWEVPPEWTIRDAYIKNGSGERIVDFHSSNLHVVNYSVPVHARLSLEELRPHLHSVPEHPDWIPYRASFYREAWGFCLPHRQLESLGEDNYEVCIDSSLAPGHLTLAELYVPGAVEEEVLIYTHTCHPSLCNDNLSALIVTTLLAERWSKTTHRFSYRFVFGPATIGSLTWLSRNEDVLPRVRHGLVLASLGDPGPFTYKRSRRGDADIDRIASYLVERDGGACQHFAPYGYDERQFRSPGFNLPMGRLTRSPNATYPEYHTSADNLDFITPAALGESLRMCEAILGMADRNARYLNLSPKGEPRLGPRGLFNVVGGRPSEFEHALLWILTQSDGGPDLLAIAEKSDLNFDLVVEAAAALERAALVRELS